MRVETRLRWLRLGAGTTGTSQQRRGQKLIASVDFSSTEKKTKFYYLLNILKLKKNPAKFLGSGYFIRNFNIRN